MDICARNECSYCCREMWINLEPADITRMEAAGHLDFAVQYEDLAFMRRVDEACMFLVDSRCSIYAERPDACRDFPFVTYRGQNEVDPDCRHFQEFVVLQQ